MDTVWMSWSQGEDSDPYTDLVGQQRIAHADCQRMLGLFEVNGAAVMLADGARFRLLTESGTGTDALQRQSAVKQLARRAMRFGRAGRTDAEPVPALHAMVLPLRSDDTPIGVLILHRGPTRPFSQTELAHADMAAQSLGTKLKMHRVGEALRLSERQYRALFHRNPMPMYISSFEDRRVLAANPAALALYGYREAEFLRLRPGDLLVETDPQRRAQLLHETGQPRRIEGVTRRHRRKDGSQLDVEIWTDEIEVQGESVRLVLVHDVTERTRAEHELARLRRAQQMLSACNDALVRSQDEADLLGRVCRISTDIGGFRRALVAMALDDEAHTIQVVDWPGQPDDAWRQLRLSWHPDRPGGWGPMARAIRSGQPCVIEDLTVCAHGLLVSEPARAMGLHKIVALPLRDGERTFGVLELLADTQYGRFTSSELDTLMELADNLAHGIGHQRARAQRRQDEARIVQLAYSDALTGLPNRARLQEMLAQNLEDARSHGRWGSLMLLDIHNLKALNEVWGHAEGDRLLASYAQRLQGLSPGVCARLGADEFVVLFGPHAAHEAQAMREARACAEQLIQTMAHTHHSEGWVFECRSSAGLVLFNGSDGGPGELLQRAEIALYAAKARGPQSLLCYDRELHATVVARAQLDQALREALTQRQFELHYQPQCDATGRWVGAEALVRWRHPQRGFVSPGEFIPLCEENGLILRLGLQVLEMACATLAEWQKNPALRDMVLSVNVSARQFRQPEFVRQVANVLRTSGAPAHHLKLELTESVMVEDVEQVIEKMKALRLMGVSFSLDDFGTGYSSLGQLKRLPLDQLKIDQSFVRDALSDPNNATIARTVITLGQSLGLDVVAEGVETAAQHAFLGRHGCAVFQGYLFSRPVPRADFELLVSQPATSTVPG